MITEMDIIDRIRDYLDQNDWHYEYEDDRKIIRAGVNLKSKLRSVRLVFTFNDSGYTVLAVCPMQADEETRASVMEYVTRANYGLRNGNFELDLRDGEVRYKVYVNLKKMENINDLGEDIIEDSVMLPPLMFDRYGDGMAAIMLGFSTPEEEIKKVENR